MISWQYFPKSSAIPDHLQNVVAIFKKNIHLISSDTKDHNSDHVLSLLRKYSVTLGFKIEKSKKSEDKIEVPVLFGKNGTLEKAFDADGIQYDTKTILEIEAGRGVLNNQFLKDLFEACMMHDIDY